MRVVALEEHFFVPELIDKSSLGDRNKNALKPQIFDALADLGPLRLKSMDAGHVTQQVISAAAPGADLFPGEKGIQFAKATNDRLAAATKQHPDRFAGFAHLPMQEPEAAAQELKRAVKELNFCGALINGTTKGLFLDDPQFEPILKMAEELDVPLYLHPALPPEPVRKAYYDKLPDDRGLMLSMAGFGWHAEVAIHILRLAVSGTLDRHPKLKLIIGHMGEMLPFMMERSEQVFNNQIKPDTKPISVKATILKHVWITTSGFFTTPPFLNALQVFGADRIMYSVDYPFAQNEVGWKFLTSLPVSPTDLEKIVHKNADQLLRLTHS